MKTTMKGRLFQFHMWVAHPTTLSSLQAILKKLLDEDLLELMRNVGSKQALTIAWAEYGRRHANVNIEFEMKSTDVLSVRASDLIIGHGVSLVC